jgi:hypothetical protein
MGEGARKTEAERSFEKSAKELDQISDDATADVTRWGSQAQHLLEAALEAFYDADDAGDQ